MRLPVLESIISGECRKSDGSWVFPAMMVNRGKFDKTLPFEWDENLFFDLSDISNLDSKSMPRRCGRDWSVSSCEYNHPAVKAVYSELKDVCRQVCFFDNEYRNYDVFQKICDDTLRSLTNYYLTLADYVADENFWRDIVHVLGVFTMDFYIEYRNFFVNDVRYDTLRAVINDANKHYGLLFRIIKDLTMAKSDFENINLLQEEKGINKCLSKIERLLSKLYIYLHILDKDMNDSFNVITQEMVRLICDMEDYFVAHSFNLQDCYVNGIGFYEKILKIDFTDTKIINTYNYLNSENGIIKQHLYLRDEEKIVWLEDSALDKIIDMKEEFDKEVTQTEDKTTVALGKLAFLNGEYDGERLMSEGDFERLMRWVEVMIKDRRIEEDVEPIVLRKRKDTKRVWNKDFLKCALREVHDVVYEHNNDSWIEFMARLLGQKVNTIKSKFRDTPNDYEKVKQAVTSGV
jgi:hypothetical protein